MQTVSRILCAAAVAGIVMNAASAEGAGVWGWLERLSGPGPFEQRFGHIGARAICPRAIALPRSDAKTDSVPVRILSTDVGSTCFYVDRADFVSRNDAFVGGTSDITATVWGFGLTTLMVR